jgi:hypothetical protein
MSVGLVMIEGVIVTHLDIINTPGGNNNAFNQN